MNGTTWTWDANAGPKDQKTGIGLGAYKKKAWPSKKITQRGGESEEDSADVRQKRESTKIGTEKRDTQSGGERKENTADVRQKKNERDSTKIGTAGSDTPTVGERKEDFANEKVNSKAAKKKKKKRKKEVKVISHGKKVSFDLGDTSGTTKSVRQVNGSLKPALKKSPLNLVKSWTTIHECLHIGCSMFMSIIAL